MLKQSLVTVCLPSRYSKLYASAHSVLTEVHKFSPLKRNFMTCLNSTVFERLLLERPLKFLTLRLGRPFIHLANISQVPCYHSTFTVSGNRAGTTDSKFEEHFKSGAHDRQRVSENIGKINWNSCVG